MNSISNKKEKKHLSPSSTIVLSFAAIILVGTFLLTLPFMTRDSKGLSLFTAFFTAVSSVCVCGLTLIDPAVTLTAAGQAVLLLLIELGGISFVTFATFFIFVFKKRSGLKNLRLAQEYTNIDTFSQVKPLVRTIIIITFSCQLVGAILLSFRFVPLYGLKGFWISVFTSVSAYYNAGFDLFGFQKEFGSLSSFNGDGYVLTVIMLLIIAGSLGFFVLHDIIEYRKNKRLTLHSKITLIFSLSLIVIGFLGFLIFEGSNEKTLGSLSAYEKFWAAMFQSVTARSAGFSSVDLSQMREISKLFMIFLMFVGAGSGSTGGGIKISTFAVLIMTVFSVIKNRNETVILGKRIDKRIVAKSVSIMFLFMSIVFVSTGFLIIDLPNGTVINILFEAVSALAPTGATVGITSQLGPFGLSVIMISMFLGRVGPVCFMVSLNSKDKTQNKEILPEGRIMVG